jgi:hypothetical protein
MRLHVPTDGSLRMQLEILLLYALVWSSLAVLSSTAEYPFEAIRVSLIAGIRSHGNYGLVLSSLLVLRIDYNNFPKSFGPSCHVIFCTCTEKFGAVSA